MKKLFAVVCILGVVGFGFRAYADDIAPLPDTTSPVITLIGDSAISVTEDSVYTDAGATAIDDVDGDISTHISINGSVDTTTPGVYTLTYSVSDAAGNAATPLTRTVTVISSVVPVQTETVLIRNGDTVIYSGQVSLPTAGTISVNDNTGVSHDISTDSVLGLVYAVSQSSGSFSLSDLAYYSSLNSVYLKCITPTGGSVLCDNWQYVVNGSTPGMGMDAAVLSGGETVGLYFGSPHQVSLSATSVAKGTSFTASAESYNYTDNTWSALTGVTIGVTVPNPNDLWTPTVVTTQAVDTEGKATITLADAGEYSVGIAEDFYFPSYSLTVTEPVIVQGGGGGGSGPTPTFSVERALSYLYSVQNPDGSFGSDLYTDWAAVAYAAVGASESQKTALLNYLFSHARTRSLLTDNERAAIAVLSLGENPYAFNGADYISLIVSSFDGTQFGDTSLVNDDIFALIPLSAAGYSLSDEIIAKDIQFLVDKQRADGSWEGSVDLTAAAIGALRTYNAAPDASAKASLYLQNNQQADGGFGSVYSTSWVMQAEASWAKNGKTPANYLAGMQASDGAAISASESINNRVWATSYAIPASLGKSWSAIMHSVAKPQAVQAVSSSVTIVEDTKKEADTVSKTEESKPKEVVAELAPETVEKTPTVLVSAKKQEVIQKPAVTQHTETEEEKPMEPLGLTAAAQGSNTHIPTPVIIGSIVGIGVLAFATRKFFLS